VCGEKGKHPEEFDNFLEMKETDLDLMKLPQ